MNITRGPSKLIVIMPFLMAASMLAITFSVHQASARTVDITFFQFGVGPDFMGTVITINGSDYNPSQLPTTLTCTSGSIIIFSFASPLSGSSGVQYTWDNTTGLSNYQNESFAVTGKAGNITGNYKTQYYLTVSSAHGSPNPLSNWFDSGTEITESVDSITPGTTGTQYVCSGWTGTGSVPSSGGGSLTTFTINAASSIVWNWKIQYQITFDETGVGGDFLGTVATIDGANYSVNMLPVSFWWDNGSNHDFSFASPLLGGSTQYSWNSTSGLSTMQSEGLTVVAPGSIIGDYVVENQVTFDQVGIGSDFTGTIIIIDSVSYSKSQMPVSFSWALGSVHSFALQSPLIVDVNSKQYVWTITTGLSSLQSDVLNVSSYGSITGNYKTQYHLTVISANDSPSPLSGWFDSGSGVIASVTSPISGGSGVQYVCTGWTGSGSVPGSGSGLSVSFVIDAASAITWNWKTQYQVIMDQTGVSVDFVGSVLAVDGFNYVVIDLPVTFWWDSGSSHSFSFASPLVVGAKQYTWNSTSGLSTFSNGTLIVTSRGSIIGNYLVQNQVSFDQVGVSSDFVGTVIIIDSVGYSNVQLPVSFSWSLGSTHSFAFQSPLIVGANSKQYVWTGTTGLSSLEGDTINVTVYGSIVGAYKTQYYLSVASQYDSPSPASGWFDTGTFIQESVNSPILTGTGTQQVCTGWSGTGSVPAFGSSNFVAFIINAPSSVSWNWKTQYQLTVFSAYGTASGEGWYDSGSTAYATLALGTVSGTPGIQYVFVAWTGGASGTDTISGPITMDGPKTASADWKTQYYLTVNSAYSIPIGSGWYDSSTTAYARLQNGTYLGTAGIQYVFVGWLGDASGTVYSQSNGIIMDSPKTAAANWTAAMHILTILPSYGSVGGSTVPSAGIYPLNDSSPVTVTATSGIGYTFEYWTLDGQNYTGNPISVAMNTDHTLIPVFQIQNFTLTILSSDNGTTIPAAGVYSYNFGTNVTITASPIAGYEFDHWLLDNTTITANPTSVTLSGNHTLESFFRNVTQPPAESPDLTMYLTIFAILVGIFFLGFIVFVIIQRRR